MDCVFCKIINREIPSRIIYEDDKVISFMNNMPCVDGHILIVPKEHYEDFTSVPNDIMNYVIKIGEKLSPKIMSATNSTGMTFSFNFGTSITVNHFHLHLLPNLTHSMLEVLGSEKIKVSESIDDVFDKIKEVL